MTLRADGCGSLAGIVRPPREPLRSTRSCRRRAVRRPPLRPAAARAAPAVTGRPRQEGRAGRGRDICHPAGSPARAGRSPAAGRRARSSMLSAPAPGRRIAGGLHRGAGTARLEAAGTPRPGPVRSGPVPSPAIGTVRSTVARAVAPAALSSPGTRLPGLRSRARSASGSAAAARRTGTRFSPLVGPLVGSFTRSRIGPTAALRGVARRASERLTGSAQPPVRQSPPSSTARPPTAQACLRSATDGPVPYRSSQEARSCAMSRPATLCRTCAARHVRAGQSVFRARHGSSSLPRRGGASSRPARAASAMFLARRWAVAGYGDARIRDPARHQLGAERHRVSGLSSGPFSRASRMRQRGLGASCRPEGVRPLQGRHPARPGWSGRSGDRGLMARLAHPEVPKPEGRLLDVVPRE